MVCIQDIPNIIIRIRNRCKVDESVLAALAAKLEPCRFPKRTLLVCDGEARGKAFFIETGITRSYWIVDGEEVTTSFSTEGTLVFSMDEVYYGKPSEECVEAIEPVLAYSIRVADLRRIVTDNIDMAVWWGLIHEDEYRRLHLSHKERLTLPAAERYRAFARQQPEACRRARLTDIASYLGITPSTLSRIRASKTVF